MGKRWNQKAVQFMVGMLVITDRQIWPKTPKKAFDIAEDFALRYPNSTQDIVRARMKRSTQPR